MSEIERESMLRLTLTPGLGPTLIRRAVELTGSAEAAVRAGVTTWASVQGVGQNRASSLRAALDDADLARQVAREQALIERHGVHLLMLGDAAYPALLRHIPDPPVLLYVRGEWREGDALALGVVGSRKCTAYGQEQADRLSALAAQAGLCIVSGGAYGIDAAAHRAAMRVRGRTIAVLGNGIAEPYPRDHAKLFDQIADGQGAVVSEMSMTAPPSKESFPRRNRIISGLSLGVLVVEASDRSGALITARLAAEEHHREVMAVPGRVDSPTSAGCHKMIREGWATLVTSGADVLAALGETGSMLEAGLTRTTPADDAPAPPQAGLFEQHLTETQKRVMEALDQPRAMDQLVAATNLAVQVIQADLTLLQIRGLVSKSGLEFTRRR